MNSIITAILMREGVEGVREEEKKKKKKIS